MSFLDRFKKKREVAPAEGKKFESVPDSAVAADKKEAKKARTPANAVILRPVVSEKAAMGESSGKYVFAVSSGANKITVKRAIQELYGVAPKRVRIINTEGKRMRFGRTMGKQQDEKKAIVTLPKGKIISVHEGV